MFQSLREPESDQDCTEMYEDMLPETRPTQPCITAAQALRWAQELLYFYEYRGDQTRARAMFKEVQDLKGRVVAERRQLAADLASKNQTTICHFFKRDKNCAFCDMILQLSE